MFLILFILIFGNFSKLKCSNPSREVCNVEPTVTESTHYQGIGY